MITKNFNSEHFIFIVFNPLSFCKTLYYCEKYFSKDMVDIIFIEDFFKLTDKFKKTYKVHKLLYNPKVAHGFIPRLYEIIKENLLALQTKKIIKFIIKKHFNEKICLVIFKDTSIVEATCIEYMKKKLKEKSHILLIDEGTGLYAENMRPMHFFRRVPNFFMKVSSYPVEGKPYGLHPYLDTVICESPEVLIKKYKHFNYKLKDIRKQDNIFEKENCELYLNYLLENKIDIKEKFTFVFLSMPWDVSLNVTEVQYMAFIYNVLKKLSALGNVLLKLHPRDKLNYSDFRVKNVYCFPELNSLPFEALYNLVDKPIMISILSSSCSCDKNKTSYYLSDAFPSMPKMSSHYLLENNIKVCSTPESLINEIAKDYAKIFSV